MDSELNMTLLMTVSGSLAHRKIFVEISSEPRTLQAMTLTFATKYAILKMMHTFSCIYCYKSMYGSRRNTF